MYVFPSSEEFTKQDNIFGLPDLKNKSYKLYTFNITDDFIDWLIEYTEKAYSTCGDDSWNNGEWYFTTGIREEAGECSGIVKRTFRGDYSIDSDKFKNLILKEFGDVLWYSSMILFKEFIISSKEEVSFSNQQKENFKSFLLKARTSYTSSNNLIVNVFNICVFSSQVYLHDTFYKDVKEDIFNILFAIDASAKMFDLSIKDIGELNNEKLKDRKERNVIIGSGNYR